MRKISVRELQQIELDILNVFVKFCEDNQLTYMLYAGTLLGAVRHKGFIPWDDDIDVLMPRPDYDRLLNEENLDFHALGTDVEMWHWKNGKLKHPFIKFVKNNTKVVPDSEFIREEWETEGVWIDVFPLEGLPADIASCKKLYRRVYRYRRILALKWAKPGKGRTWYAKVLKPFAILALQAVPNQYICRKMDNISKSYDYNSTEYAGDIVWGVIQSRMKKDDYRAVLALEFEGRMYCVPAGYQKWLHNIYGDYMKLPPVEDRRIHLSEVYVEE